MNRVLYVLMEGEQIVCQEPTAMELDFLANYVLRAASTTFRAPRHARVVPPATQVLTGKTVVARVTYVSGPKRASFQTADFVNLV